MTKLFKKFFIATLSFVMMIACAFTFTTYKASASTNADVPAKDFTQDNVALFAIATANRIAGNYTSPSCLIVDSEFFEVDDISVGTNTTLSDISNTTFMSYFANTLGATLGIRDGVDGLAMTVSDILEEAEMEILVYLSDRSFVNVTTGAAGNATSVSNFYSRLLANTTPQLYGAIVWEIPTQFYSILDLLQDPSDPFKIYAFPKDEINYGSGTLIVAGWLGGDDFYE